MKNIFAVDLGGTYVKYAIVNKTGQVLARKQEQTANSLEELIDNIKQALLEWETFSCEGVAVSSPGSVGDDGVIYGASAIAYIHGPNMRDLLTDALGLPVEIENDANCAALAEVWQGAGKGADHLAVIVIGTGIGGALIHEGQVVKGSHLHAGEFGYMILDPNNLGSGMNTFSELGSSYSIIKRVAAAKGVSRDSLTGEAIFAAAEAGDAVCQQAIDDFYKMLATGIYNVQYAYDPELILLGGGISGRPDLVERLNEKLAEIVSKIDVATITPKIAICQFKQDANVIGATYHFINKQSEVV